MYVGDMRHTEPRYIESPRDVCWGSIIVALDHFMMFMPFPVARCACLLDSGGTIWLLWVYRDPVGIKIDSVGTSRRKWPVPKLYRLMYIHILMSMRLKEVRYCHHRVKTTLVLHGNAFHIFWHLFWIPMRVHKIKSLVMTWQNSFAYWPEMK